MPSRHHHAAGSPPRHEGVVQTDCGAGFWLVTAEIGSLCSLSHLPARAQTGWRRGSCPIHALTYPFHCGDTTPEQAPRATRRQQKSPPVLGAPAGCFVQGCDSSHVRCKSQPTVYHLSRITSFQVGHLPGSIRGDQQIKPGLVPPADRRQPARRAALIARHADRALCVARPRHSRPGRPQTHSIHLNYPKPIERVKKTCIPARSKLAKSWVGNCCAPRRDGVGPAPAGAPLAATHRRRHVRRGVPSRTAGGKRSPSVFAIDSPSSNDG